MTGDPRGEVTRLLAENRRLRELLTEHGIAWQPLDITPTKDRSPRLGTDEKVKLFASLFRGSRTARDPRRLVGLPCRRHALGPRTRDHDGHRPTALGAVLGRSRCA